MQDDINSCSSSCESEEVQKIVLHVYDDESKEFTSLTTYHGMIRIYTSTTWPSRLFWTVVVVICLVLFMIQSGALLKFYVSRPTTYKMTTFHVSKKNLPAITICPLGFKQNDYLYEVLTSPMQTSEFHFEKWENASLLKIAEESGFKCEDVLDFVSIENNYIFDACKSTETVVTDIGVCFTFREWFKYSLKPLKIYFKKNLKYDFQVRVHDVYETTTEFLDIFWGKPNTFTSFSFSIIEKKLLPQNDWGTCRSSSENETYFQSECLQECKSDAFYRAYNCEPLYSKNVNNICKLKDVRIFKNYENRKCNCAVQCSQQTFKFKSPNVVPTNRTIVKFQLNSSIINQYQQYKRFKRIDLMSYVGGVMGLFLGMSCITLLEVFIYLFKTVFGTLNDSRHQEFVDRLLGQNKTDLHRSHDEIIITKKIENHRKQDKINNNGDEMRYINEKRELNRRMSHFNFANDNNIGLKIQLYRPSISVRRHSVYQGACDF